MEQFRDNKTSKFEFENLVERATTIDDSGKRNFLYINKGAKYKFRKNLNKHLLFSWQADPETVNLTKPEVRKHYREIAKTEEEKPEFNLVSNNPHPVTATPKPDEVTKTYLIRGRRITFTI
jgi:hypothetical protein